MKSKLFSRLLRSRSVFFCSLQRRTADKWRFSSRANAVRTSNMTQPTSSGFETGTSTWNDRNKDNSSIWSLVKASSKDWAKYFFARSLEGQVLRQCFFYLFAFYGSIPLSFTTSILAINRVFNYPLSVVTMFAVPIQGFNNALIYFRPRAMAHLEAKRKQWSQRRKDTNSSAKPMDPARRRFLLSHFFPKAGAPTSEDQDSDIISGQCGDGEPAQEHDAEEMVTVRSFRLPSLRGSQLWLAANDASVIRLGDDSDMTDFDHNASTGSRSLRHLDDSLAPLDIASNNLVRRASCRDFVRVHLPIMESEEEITEEANDLAADVGDMADTSDQHHDHSNAKL